MEIKGIVVQVNPTQTVGTNNFKKATMWIETIGEQYPQTLEVEFVKEKADEIQSVAPGSEITIQINLKGRKWTNPQGETKVFNTIQGWKYDSKSDF
jgi:hypothetical protein